MKLLLGRYHDIFAHAQKSLFFSMTSMIIQKDNSVQKQLFQRTVLDKHVIEVL